MNIYGNQNSLDVSVCFTVKSVSRFLSMTVTMTIHPRAVDVRLAIGATE